MITISNVDADKVICFLKELQSDIEEKHCKKDQLSTKEMNHVRFLKCTISKIERKISRENQKHNK